MQGWSYFPFLSEMHGEPHLNHHKITLKVHSVTSCFITHPVLKSAGMMLEWGKCLDISAACWPPPSFLLSLKFSTLLVTGWTVSSRKCITKEFWVWIRNEGNMLGLEEHKEPRRVYRTWVLSQGAKGFIHTKKSNTAPPYPCWHW